MRRLLAICLATALGMMSPAQSSPARAAPGMSRCGWFVNPTPANAWLLDRDGEWLVAVQGGHQAQGDWPVFGPRQWIPVNGDYGYGCACLDIIVSARATTARPAQVRRILSAQALPLRICQRDTSLREPQR